MATALDVVVVPDFRPEVARRFEVRTLFFLASWLENAGRARDFPLHVACIGEPPSSVRWLAQRCDASITVHEPVGADAAGMSNKLRGLEVALREDSVLLLDNDVLVLSDFSELANLTGCTAAARAGGVGPARYWERIYPALGLPVPERRMKTVLAELGVYREESTAADIRAANSMLPYHNGGVVLSPRDSGLRAVWEDHIRRIAVMFPPDEHQARRLRASDQAALATAFVALEREGIPFRPLPDVYNVRVTHVGCAGITPDEAKLYHASKLAWKLPPGPVAVAREPERLERRMNRRLGGLQRSSEAIRAGDAGVEAIGDILRSLYLRHVMPALAGPRRRRATPLAGPVVIAGMGGTASQRLRDILAACPEIHMDRKVKENGDSRGSKALGREDDGADGEYRRSVRRFVDSVIAQIDPTEDQAHRWFGFKDPRMIRHARPLIEMYPQARFIHLIRDPRTAFPVRARQGGELDGLLAGWAEAHLPVWRTYRECSRYRLVRYEALVTSPEATISSLFDWLGVGAPDLTEALSRVRQLPPAVSGKHGVDVSRIAPAVRELGYA